MNNENFNSNLNGVTPVTPSNQPTTTPNYQNVNNTIPNSNATSFNNTIHSNNGINVNYNNNFQPEKKKNNKKTILIILAILIVGLAIGAFFFFKGSNNSKETADLNSIFDPNKPIVIKKDGKYGYITSEGKMMIEPKYKSAGAFNGDYAVVTIDNPDTTSYNKKIYQIIDKKGNVMNSTESYDAPKFYSNYDVWVIDDMLYNSSLKAILNDEIKVDYISNGFFEYEDDTKDEAGIMNHKGKILFTWAGSYIYTDMSDNDNTEDDFFIRVTKSDERDLIVSLKTGKIVYTVQDAEKNHLGVEDDNIFKEYNSDYKVVKYMFFVDGKLAYQTTESLYDFEVADYKNKILELDYGYNYKDLGKSQRTYYYDVKNQQLLEKKPSSSNSNYDSDINLMELTYGYKEFSSSGSYGLMSGNKVVIPCEYNDIEFLNSTLFAYMKSKGKELVLLEKDGTTLLMNLKNQKTLTTFNSTYVNDDEDSTFLKATIYKDYSTTGYTIYNLLSGKSMSIDKNEKCSIYSNYITITKDNKKTYYNTKLEQIYVEDV